MKLKNLFFAGLGLAAFIQLSSCDSSSGGSSSVGPSATLDSVVFLGKPVVISDSLLVSLIGQTSTGSALQLSNSQITVKVDSVTSYYSTSTTTSATVQNVQNTPAAGSAPLATQIIMDGSGSMGSSDPDALRKTAGKAYVNFLGGKASGSKVALAEFGVGSDSGYYFHLWKDFTPVSSPNSIAPYFDSLSEEGSTPLYTSIRRGLEHLDTAVSRTAFNRTILAFTDGGDNDSYNRDSVGSVIAKANALGVSISSVGLGSSIQASDLFRMAIQTGGVFGAVDSASQLAPLFTAISQSSLFGASNVYVKLGSQAMSGSIYYVTITVTVNGKVEKKQFAITAQ